MIREETLQLIKSTLNSLRIDLEHLSALLVQQSARYVPGDFAVCDTRAMYEKTRDAAVVSHMEEFQNQALALHVRVMDRLQELLER